MCVTIYVDPGMKLEGYRFGRIEVDGVPYHEDLWVCAGRVGSWWRREGHRVHPEDLSEVLELGPEVVVIGTGFSGMLRVTEEAEALLSLRGVELRVAPTKEAVALYNELAPRKQAAALLHLTC
jgi:hypothetical protein